MSAFKGSLRRFEILSKIILWIISLTLFFFLVQLGDRVLDDMDNWFDSPSISDFQNREMLKQYRQQKEVLDKKISSVKEKMYHISKSREIARRKYNSEKKSFEVWLDERKTIGSPSEDTRIRERASKLDRYRKIQEAWDSRISTLETEIRSVEKELDALNRQKDKTDQEDRKKYNKAYKKYSVYLFLIRLAFVLPILGLAVFLFIRFRRSRLKALMRGYILFALYAFFVGLVPYLPSFGGYIRYSVGIALTIAAGIYVVKQLAAFAEKKKAELEQSTEERSKQIKHETALKAYTSHCCPSCEKDFLMKNWQPKTKVLKDIVLEDEAPSFCQHCGLRLFTECSKCGTRNFAHFPFCSNCGNTLQG